jgi:LPXTG-motif cell wall-anchored protein
VEINNTPYSSSSGACDEARNGWHIIMNGITTFDGEPPAAEDFGPVNLTFSDGSTAQALFTDASGSQVAHFLNNNTNQNGFFEVTAGAMTFPNGTRITSFNQFVISHPPCGTIVTTTTNPVTTETTTTTSPVVTTDTTTTVPDTTTTINPVITVPTTTIPPGTPTVDTATVERQVQAARTARAATGSTLPTTGIDGGPFVLAGLLLLAAGTALLVVTRRRATA